VITTPQLIDSLVRDLPPVRPLRRPVLRCAMWLALAAIVVGLVAIGHGVRPDLAEKIAQPGFLVAIGAALATGILAAIAAFLVSLPDRSRLWLLLPVPTLILWMTTLGQQCLTDWVAAAPDGGTMPGATAKCFMTLVTTGLPLQIALLIMLRYAAPLRPLSVAVTGALAVAALTCAALLVLNRDLDATALVLMSNLAMAALVLGLARLFAPKFFVRGMAATAGTAGRAA
jgi:hypothetical protein